MSGRSAFQFFCCLKVGSKMTSNCSEAALTLAAMVLRDWWICHETHRSNYINSKVCFCIRRFLFTCLVFCFVFPWKLKTHQYILQLVSVKQLVVVPPFAAVSRLKSMKDWTSVCANTSFPIKHQTYGKIREAQREKRTPARSRIGSIFLKSWFSVTTTGYVHWLYGLIWYVSVVGKRPNAELHSSQKIIKGLKQLSTLFSNVNPLHKYCASLETRLLCMH